MTGMMKLLMPLIVLQFVTIGYMFLHADQNAYYSNSQRSFLLGMQHDIESHVSTFCKK